MLFFWPVCGTFFLIFKSSPMTQICNYWNEKNVFIYSSSNCLLIANSPVLFCGPVVRDLWCRTKLCYEVSLIFLNLSLSVFWVCYCSLAFWKIVPASVRVMEEICWCSLCWMSVLTRTVGGAEQRRRPLCLLLLGIWLCLMKLLFTLLCRAKVLRNVVPCFFGGMSTVLFLGFVENSENLLCLVLYIFFNVLVLWNMFFVDGHRQHWHSTA